MLRQFLLILPLSGLIVGGCTIHWQIDDGPGDNSVGTITIGGSTTTYLDLADATMVISRPVGDNTARVAATIRSQSGRTVRLTAGQSVEVNGVALTRPDAKGEYGATVDAASTYTITVDEPSHGVQNTEIDSPPEFEVTSPAEGGRASLSGFTLTWTKPNDRLQVEIELSQVLAGELVTVTFGPYTDTGEREFLARDLSDLRQGAELVITVTKVNTVNRIAGFDSGTASVRVGATRTVVPGP